MPLVNKYINGNIDYETWMTPIDENENYLVYLKQREENKIHLYKAIIVYLGSPQVVETKEYKNLPNLLKAYNWLDSCYDFKLAPVQTIDVKFGCYPENRENAPRECGTGFCPVNIVKD